MVESETKIGQKRAFCKGPVYEQRSVDVPMGGHENCSGTHQGFDRSMFAADLTKSLGGFRYGIFVRVGSEQRKPFL